MKTDFSLDSEPSVCRLSDMPPGSECEVMAVDLGDAAGRRMLDLGFLPGTRVQVLRRAPLGDPSLYALRGFQLCLRAADSRHVRVTHTEPR
ncbi:ferrous iron transport protein A [Myxococcota bacterium]|nr:ferrous iron transport protein A [Myxococcota bacterium]